MQGDERRTRRRAWGYLDPGESMLERARFCTLADGQYRRHISTHTKAVGTGWSFCSFKLCYLFLRRNHEKAMNFAVDVRVR
eukprot:4232519-Pleurochrysis_carterae.AAC.4